MSQKILTIVSLCLFFAVTPINRLRAEEKALAKKKTPQPKITFDQHIRPILRQKCFSCHNIDKKKGDLVMTNYTSLMEGGGSGETSIEPGDSSSSYLYKLVSHQEKPYMPLKSPKLPDNILEIFRQWIDGGALENAGSKATLPKKQQFDFTLKAPASGKPDGPPPLPARMSLEPFTRTKRAAAVTAMATNPWSPLVAIAGQKQVLLYHARSLNLLGTLPFPEGVPHVLKFSRNGQLLLAGGGRGGARGLVVLWNVQTGQRVLQIGDELDVVLAADISADQSMIALGGPQRVVRVYSTHSHQLLYQIRKHTDWIYSLAFSPDGVLLSTADRGGGLFVWEARTGREYLTLQGHKKSVNGLSWRSDSNVLASCGQDGTIRMWEMDNGKQIKNWTAHRGGTADVEFARDGRIVSCGRDRIAKIWDQSGKAIRKFEPFDDLALRVTICDETNRVISGDWTGTIRVWNTSDGKRVGDFSSNPPMLAEQLEAASKLLEDRQTRYKPLSDAAASALAAAEQSKTKLAEAQKVRLEAKNRAKMTTAQATAAIKALTETTADYQGAASETATLESVIPLLKESLNRVQQAAENAKSDKELTEFTANLRSITNSRIKQLELARKSVSEKKISLEKSKLEVASTKKLSTGAALALESAQKQVETLSIQNKTAQSKAMAAKKSAEEMKSSVAEAQKLVERWKGEIAFTKKLKTLYDRRAAAMENLASRSAHHQKLVNAAKASLAAVEKAKTDLAAAQKNIEDMEKRSNTFARTLDSMKQGLNQATLEHQQAADEVPVMQRVVASLEEVVNKANSEAANSSGDQKLTAAAAKLNQLLEGQKTQLAAARKLVEEKKQALGAAEQRVVEAQKETISVAARKKTLRTRFDQLTALVKPTAEKASKASQAAHSAKKAVEEAQKDLDQLNTEIASTRGMNPSNKQPPDKPES